MPFRPTIMGTHGMVATEHYLSALIGVDILKRGGNAVDAAVAATFAEGVLNPHMHTIGGEVPMLIYMADSGQVSAINGNTAAPQRATIEWFTDQGMSLIPGEGLLAAGVPAAPGALITALERFGTMTLGRRPAARAGFGPRWLSCASGAGGSQRLSGILHLALPRDVSGALADLGPALSAPWATA